MVITDTGNAGKSGETLRRRTWNRVWYIFTANVSSTGSSGAPAD